MFLRISRTAGWIEVDNDRVRCGLLIQGLIVILAAPSGVGQSPSPRVPEEVRFKTGYINPVSKPANFTSAMFWGIAIADTRVPGYEQAQIEIASTQLSCRINGRELILNKDEGAVRGGLYIRIPWFAGNRFESMPMAHSASGFVILPVGQRPGRIWHFWAASPRAKMPDGKLEGCTVKARVRISPGALLQVGMDYWRDPTVPFGSGGNNHEAGASNWYFPSDRWEEAVFSDIAPQR